MADLFSRVDWIQDAISSCSSNPKAIQFIKAECGRRNINFDSVLARTLDREINQWARCHTLATGSAM